MNQTGLLPSISFCGNRWWLPLSSQSANTIAQAFMGLHRPGEPQAITNATLDDVDPALSIWLMLERQTCHRQREAADNVDRLSAISMLADAFASSDRLLGAPNPLDHQHRAWHEVWQDPSRCQDPAAWMQVTGPEVPEILLSGGFELGCEQQRSRASVDSCPDYGMNRLDLSALLRLLQRSGQLSDQFASSLHREKLASMKQLAYGLSHEINNPLANISTRAQSLMREEASADRKRMLQAIVKQAMRAYEMIADMMFYANPPQPVLKEIDLTQCVRIIVEEAAATAELQPIELTSDIGADCTVRTDPAWIGDALRALIRNAAEAIVPPGQIHVQLTKHDDRFELSVADSGKGLDANQRRHAFDPFFSGREAGRGLGLGLCKTDQIVESLGGKIQWAASPVGAKVIVVLYFDS